MKGGGRLRSISMIVIVDIAAPLATYFVLRSAGLAAVEALLISGVFPALKTGLGVLRNRRLDVIGALVLTGRRHRRSRPIAELPPAGAGPEFGP